jgi:hypothetical protein
MTQTNDQELITAIEALLVKFFPVIGGVSTVALLPLAAIAEPFVLHFIEALAEAEKLTKEQGWHWVIPMPGDPEHPNGQPYITRDAVVIVSDTPTPPEGG